MALFWYSRHGNVLKIKKGAKVMSGSALAEDYRKKRAAERLAIYEEMDRTLGAELKKIMGERKFLVLPCPEDSATTKRKRTFFRKF